MPIRLDAQFVVLGFSPREGSGNVGVNQFPISLTQGPIAFMVEPQFFMDGIPISLDYPESKGFREGANADPGRI